MYISTNLMSHPLHLIDENGAPFYLNPPLFLYILAFIFFITGSSSIATAHIVVLCFGAGTIICTAILAKRLWNREVALLAALLLASNPLFFFFESRLLLDIPLTFATTLTILLLTEKKVISFYMAAIASTAIKYPAILLLGIPLLKHYSKKVRCSPLLIVVAALLPLIALIQLKSTGILPSGWWDYFLSFLETPDWHQVMQEFYYLTPLQIPLLLIGFIHFVRKNADAPLAIWFTLFLLVRIFLPWGPHRYSLPIYPPLMLFSAYGLYIFTTFLRSHLPNKPALSKSLQMAIFLLIISINLAHPALSGHYTNRFTGYQAPAQFITQQHISTIISPSPRQFKYYLPTVTVIDLPRDSLPSTIDQRLQTEHIEAIILDRWSPHMPSWAISHFTNNTHYNLAYQNKNFAIFLPAKASSP